MIDTSKIMQSANKKREKKVYSKVEVLNMLYDYLEPVYKLDNNPIIDQCKYVKIARDYKLDHYRFCTYKDIIDLHLLDSFTTYQKKFIANAGAVVIIFNTIGGNVISAVFRSIKEKDFMDLSDVYCLYGIDLIPEDFKFGDYLIVCEGLYDADSLRILYPNVVATLTSNITMIQCNILKSMTDKFIIAFDNDRAGDDGFSTALKRLGTDIKKLKIYPRDKDVGVLEEVRGVNSFEYEERKNFYLNGIEECKSLRGFRL